MNEPRDPASSSNKDSKRRYQYQRRHTVGFVVTALVMGLIIASYIAHSWATFWVAVVFGCLYSMMLLWPVFLAIITKKPPVE